MVSTHLNSQKLESIINQIQRQKKTVVILGPTASGKTGLAHTLFDELKKQNICCELVNLDAFQIYENLNAGTAKPSKEEIKQYKYHGIDICQVSENLDANTFAAKMHLLCKEIESRGNLPICVGGSGLYLRAFLHGLDALPKRDDVIRAQIQQNAEQHGWPWCHAWLARVDPVRAAELHPNDKTRIERALEIFLITGIPASDQRSKTNSLEDQKTLFDCYVIHLEPDVDVLKKRIEQRIPILFEQGWIAEVENLYKQYGDGLETFHSMRAIGYADVLAYIKNNQNISLPALYQEIYFKTWHYAKRQLTWNAKEKKDFVL